MPEPATGHQFEIRHGKYTAVVTELGATIRSLSHGGRSLVLGYREDEPMPNYRGAFVAPWPNRITDGQYSVGGVDYQLALTEPEREVALHGLVCFLPWTLKSKTESSVTLTLVQHARPDYPFEISYELTYELSQSGLRVTTTAANTGTRGPAPYGTCPHPYLRADGSSVDGWTLQIGNTEVLEVEPERLIPTTTPATLKPAAESGLDFTGGRVIGAAQIDHAFTSLDQDAQGWGQLTLTAESGSGVGMRWDENYTWFQIFSGDNPNPDFHRKGVALEPMTCPPDAYNSGTDLISLAPGEAHSAQWEIYAINP